MQAEAERRRAGRGGASVRCLASQTHLTWALGVLLAGAGGAAVTVYDRGNVTDAANENSSELVAFQVGWGLNLAMGASIVLGVVGLIVLLRGLDAPSVRTESEGQEVASSPDASGTQPAVTAATVGDLSELADLHGRGALSDDEFRLAKERMLPSLGPTTPSVQSHEAPNTASQSEGVATIHREAPPTGFICDIGTNRSALGVRSSGCDGRRSGHSALLSVRRRDNGSPDDGKTARRDKRCNGERLLRVAERRVPVPCVRLCPAHRRREGHGRSA